MLEKLDYSPRVRRIVTLLDSGAMREALALIVVAEGEVDRGEAIVLQSFHAIAHVHKGEPLPGLRIANEARDAASAPELAMYRAEVDQALIFSLQALDEHATAIELATECERFAREHRAFELVARSLRAQATSLSVLGQHDAAIEKLRAAIVLFEAHSPYIARTLHAKYLLLAATDRAMTERDTASAAKPASYREQADRWKAFAADAEAHGMGRLHSMALGNAAVAVAQTGETPHAIVLLREALERQDALQLNIQCAATECHIAAAHGKLGDITLACSAYRRGIDRYGESSPREIARAWHQLANLHERIGDDSGALRALRQALAAEKKFNDQAAVLAAVKAEQQIEIAKLAANWARVAEQDPLTGLPNRRAFDQRIARELSALAGLESGDHLALAIVDVDHFKRVNDTFGHQAGDQVLRALGHTLTATLRDGDFVARLGGEEFVLLFVCSGIEQAQLLAERAITAVRNVNWEERCAVTAVTASVGVALHTEPTAAANELVNALYLLADQRLYLAKNQGRDRVVARDDFDSKK